MTKTRVVALVDFAVKNGWLKLYDEDGEYGWLLPDRTTVIATASEDGNVTKVTGSDGEIVTCGKEK